MPARATISLRVRMIAIGLMAVALSVGVMLAVTLTGTGTAGLLGVLDIYRGAVSTALAGEDLYAYAYLHPTVHGLGFTVWLAVAAGVAVLAYCQAARHLRDGNPLAAALAVGALSVAVSPISWPHHMLWLVFAACWYLLVGGRTATLLGAALFVVFLGHPWFDDYPAGTVGPLLGFGVESPALAVLIVLGFGLLPGRRKAPVKGPATGVGTAR